MKIAPMLEGTWRVNLVRDLRGEGCYVMSKGGHAGDGPGWPDLWVAHPDWSGWVELKVVMGKRAVKCTPRQMRVMAQMNHAAGKTIAVVLARRQVVVNVSPTYELLASTFGADGRPTLTVFVEKMSTPGCLPKILGRLLIT